MSKDLLRRYGQSAVYSLTASLTIVAMLFASFTLMEPIVSHGQVDSTTFYISQTITDGSSIEVSSGDLGTVTMQGNIDGVAGGNATGTNRIVVRSNNAAGYTVDIKFASTSAADTEAMRGESDGGQEIRDFDLGATTSPLINFTASTAAQFAYTIQSTSTSDVANTFLDNGTYCGVGSETANRCWMQPATSTYDILDTSSAAPATGATSTLFFKVHVPSGANPVPTAQTYTATATLTLYIK